jgi:phospholipid/cholesterol/gamma-HCH transport system permease protein
MTEEFAGNGWAARIEGRNLSLALTGDWTARDCTSKLRATDSLIERPGIKAISFDSTSLGPWDSSLLVFLSMLREGSLRRHIVFDQSGLPEPACRLLAMLPEEPQSPDPAPRGAGVVNRLGVWGIDRWSDMAAITSIIGETTLRTLPAIRGRARTRVVDLVRCIEDAGLAALPMVALVNVLVGGIVAFVGSIQLKRFGAEVYVSNLIGVMEIREMAPLITAIVMAGRTGSAYAAEIATMQGSDEIDALRAIGIPLFDYLILPRITALAAMMPLLFVYGAAIGIAGGFGVAVSLMNLSAGGFLAHLRSAIADADLALGLVKSVTFGAWIAISSCQIGLKAGRSATDVGQAATRAAVSGIIGVIALDALFDVCANALGI